MPRKRTSPETIIHKLREAEILISQGHPVREAAKQIGIVHLDTISETLSQIGVNWKTRRR